MTSKSNASFPLGLVASVQVDYSRSDKHEMNVSRSVTVRVPRGRDSRHDRQLGTALQGHLVHYTLRHHHHHHRRRLSWELDQRAYFTLGLSESFINLSLLHTVSQKKTHQL